MAKRGCKLLALALSLLVAGRSFVVCFVALVETPQVVTRSAKRHKRHKSPSSSSRTTRCTFSASDAAQFLEPLGISLKDIVVELQAANNNIDSLSGQTSLVDSKYAPEHAESLAKSLVEGTAKSEQFRNIFLPRISLPRIPVNGTKFQHLVSNVLSDTSFTGASAIHAEPGVGKSVAVALAMLEWAKNNPKSITVLFRGSVARLKDFFKVEDITLVPVVAELLFPILEEAGVRLQLILDNIFDIDLAEGKIVIDLARAAFDYGQVIIVTQSEVVAKDVDDLNGLRTRLAPQQEDVKEYRWNKTQAIQLFVALNATKRVNSSEPKEIEQAVKKTLQEFKEDRVAISKTLESAQFPDGGWTPVGIIQFRRSGKQPVSPAGRV